VDGILLIDKPEGPTSHDVVARIRRATRERSVGHTGTLDPRATGLLPLVLGRATRLASLLTGSDKTYDATIRFGFSTSTDDAEGEALPVEGPETGAVGRAAVDAALERFRGTFEQRPPAHSAKKVDGRRAYELARRDIAVELKPVAVTVRELTLLALDEALARVRVTATAGFYVRALARDLGAALGCGGHLVALRRIRSGTFDLSAALPLQEAERLGEDIVNRLISPADALPALTAVELTEFGLKRVRHGNPVGPEHLAGQWVPPPSTPGPVKLLDAGGALVALAHSRGGALHPVTVLG
jgi:tRNA pseudouridine55 synthase